MTISNLFDTRYTYFLSGLITSVFLLSCESEEDFRCIIDSNTPIEKKI